MTHDALRRDAGAPDRDGAQPSHEGPRLAPSAGDGSVPIGAMDWDGRGAESSHVRFTVPGPAVGKGRPRVGKAGKHTRLYTPEKTVNYEGLVAWSAAQAMAGQALIEGAVRVEMQICCAVPASWSKVKQARALSRDIHPTTKPDVDNVEKAIFDAMNGVVWKDDVQVVQVQKVKYYSAAPRVTVLVVPL